MLQQQVNPASHQLTCLASATLAKCCFLCTVLAENPEYHNLAFRVGLYGLEMARPPANTKPLEVKFAPINEVNTIESFFYFFDNFYYHFIFFIRSN